MTGIPSKLIQSLREVLAECEPFETDRGVRNLFSDKRIITWRNSLPQADTLIGRVESVISYLHDKKNSSGSNALVLMLFALVDLINEQDGRNSRVKNLAYELIEVLDNHESFSTRAPDEKHQRFYSPSATSQVYSNQTKQVSNTNMLSKNIQTKAGIKKTNFFISYNRNDKKWAEWIAWQLEKAGYTTVIQAWDFRPGSNFVMAMQKATAESERTIAVLSPDYLSSRFTQPEWTAAFALDPTGEKGILLPIRVRDCELTGLLPQIVFVDLIGLSANEAVELLLSGIKRGRAKPLTPPNYPSRVEQEEPEYPNNPSKSTFS